MQIKITLDAGINIYSKKEIIEDIDSEMWDNMSEIEQEEFIKEIALEGVNWYFNIIAE